MLNKVVSKIANKASVKMSAKVPFHKLQKAPPPREKPKLWPQEAWEAYVVCRKYETAALKVGRVAAGMKASTVTTAVHMAALTTCGDGAEGSPWSGTTSSTM
jgi:hypothetical protein